jgi:hypothetical protein
MRGRSARSRAVTAAAAGITILLALTACSDDENGGGGQAAPTGTASAGGAQDLKGVCPDPIVIQKDWQPESEHGAIYTLVGPGYKIDTNAKKVTGPLVADGVDTGVKIEVRSGGPAVGFQPVPAVMYTDKSIHIGFVATDETVQYSDKQPVMTVMTPLEISPLAIIWDPKQHPEFNTISDIGQTDTTVLYTQGLAYMDYLTGSGILRRSQLNGSYTGAPDLFLQSGGKAALQGFGTSEPYLYEKEIKAWGKPMDFQLVNDTGYPQYFSTLAIRSGEKEQLAPCLEKLVPIIQKSAVQFAQNPDPAIKIILDLVPKYNTGWQYSQGLADYSAKAMLDLGIVANGPDETIGNVDMGRIQKIIDITTPIFTGQKKPIKADLKPEDIATNEFIDESIGLEASGSN